MSNRGAASPASPARRYAFDILRRVEKEGAFASILIAGLPQSKLSKKDRALTQEIVLGSLRWQKSLDYSIGVYSERSTEELDTEVLIALRIGLYQLRYLTRVPVSAAVSESVKLVKSARMRSAAGFVNAVLRRAAGDREARSDLEGLSPSERPAVELSHPSWLLDRWTSVWGLQESRELAVANNLTPCHSFRLNTLKSGADEILSRLASEGIDIEPSALVAGAYRVIDGEAGRLIRLQEQGLIYLQDEASQLVSLLLESKPHEKILDICAAPGSKSSHIAVLTSNQSWILACDLHTHRLAALRSLCSRQAATRVDCLALDATNELPFLANAPPFDRVLVDAPCTGTGTLRRNPEIKWRLREEEISRMAMVQSAILRQASTMVKEGGRLVYATCSLEQEEDEAVVTDFLRHIPGFRTVRPQVDPQLISGCYVRTFPHLHGMDGFFAAVMERRAS